MALTKAQWPHCYRRSEKIHGQAWKTEACKLEKAKGRHTLPSTLLISIKFQEGETNGELQMVPG